VKAILRACAMGLGTLVVLASSGRAQERGLEAGPSIGELIEPLANRAPRWRCGIARRFVCSSQGCEGASGGGWVDLDFLGGDYRRCDVKGCDDYALRHASGGLYTTASGGLQIFLKALNDGSEFVEATSFGTSVFIAYGRCTPMR
jgi:hypothetical protein